MDRGPTPRVAVTGFGAALAGLAAASGGFLLQSAYGAVLGVALAMPLFVQIGWGFGRFDRGAYFAEQQFEDVILDSGVIVTGAALTGGIAVAVSTLLDATQAAEIAIAAGGAFGGGTAAFLRQTESYR